MLSINAREKCLDLQDRVLFKLINMLFNFSHDSHASLKPLLWLWALLSCVMIFAAACGHFYVPLNADIRNLLSGTRHLLAGDVLYERWVDVNPPLITFIYAIPVLISQAAGIAIAPVLYLCTLVLVMACLALCWRMMRDSDMSGLCALAVVNVIALPILMFCYQGELYGDREHLFVVFVAPWLVYCAPFVRRDQVSSGAQASIAVLAGIGFAIKPYFYIIYVSVILYRLQSGAGIRSLLKERDQRIIIGVGFFYALVVVLFFRQWLMGILPLAFWTYPSLGPSLKERIVSLSGMLTNAYMVYLPFCGVLLRRYRPGFYAPVIDYTLWLVAGAMVEFMCNSGWFYTQYPYKVLVFVFSVTLAFYMLRTLETISGKAWRCFWVFLGIWQATALLHNTYVAPLMVQARSDISRFIENQGVFLPGKIHAPAQKKLITALHEDPDFIMLSTNIWSVNLEAVASGSHNVSRFDYMWPLPGIVWLQNHPQTSQQGQELMDYLAGSMADDIESYKPSLIINDVSTRQRRLVKDYDILKVLSQNPRMAHAMDRYVLKERVGKCDSQVQFNCAYELYIPNSQ